MTSELLFVLLQVIYVDRQTHIHTHTHTYMCVCVYTYIHIYICIYAKSAESKNLSVTLYSSNIDVKFIASNENEEVSAKGERH